jgi:hypothetical protein
MSTQYARRKVAEARDPMRKQRVRNFWIKWVSVGLSICIISYQLEYIYKQHQVISFQKVKLASLSTYCPDIKLSTRTFQSTGRVEEEGKVPQCIYDVEEHVLQKQMGRTQPKDSRYLQ